MKTDSRTKAEAAVIAPTSVEEKIRERAYELFEARDKKEEGHELEDWLRAEAEIKAETKKAAA